MHLTNYHASSRELIFFLLVSELYLPQAGFVGIWLPRWEKFAWSFPSWETGFTWRMGSQDGRTWSSDLTPIYLCYKKRLFRRGPSNPIRFGDLWSPWLTTYPSHGMILQVGPSSVLYPSIGGRNHFSSWWFFPTHLKNMRPSNWIISPGFRGENSKNIWVATTEFS